jgi:hypothetical protein
MRRKKSLLTRHVDLKRTESQKIKWWITGITLLGKNKFKVLNLANLTKIFHSAPYENTLNYEKSSKNCPISPSFGRKKNSKSLFRIIGWNGQKTISGYCPSYLISRMFDAFCPHTNVFFQRLGTLLSFLCIFISIKVQFIAWRCSDPFVWSSKSKLTKVWCSSEMYP